MDYKLDGTTLNELISMMYCGKCNGAFQTRKDEMKENTNLKQSGESFYWGGTTLELYCPQCFTKMKICIPSDAIFWKILSSNLNNEK